jgi:hypothetical protein
MTKLALSAAIFWTFDLPLLANEIVEKPVALFQMLKSNENWTSVAKKGEVTLSTKSIKDMSLVAFMAKQKTNIPSKIIQDIVMDVKNYGQYFNSAGEFIFSEVGRYSGAVEGYHLLPVNLPFMKDREYFFRVHTGGYNMEDNVSIVHWYLIEKPEKVQMQNTSNDAIYLDYGAGLWMAERADGEYMLSYRLYLDPGGSIPNFAIELLNKMSIVNVFNDVLSEASRRNYTTVH